MGYRNIFIQNIVNISFKQNNLILDSDKTHRIPIEDINSIIIENLKTNISAYLLSKLAENNIALFICNEKHTPNGILLPFSTHSRKLTIIESQLSLKKPLIKNLWQDIIKTKIDNQAITLKLCDIDNYNKLLKLSTTVKSGDSTNVESKAASIYFKELFGKNFTRRSDNNINSSLNYGYAIIRGIIARNIAAYGFEPSIGLFHSNKLNAFNLADDLIEPFRPIVDLFVKKNIEFFNEGEFGTLKKQELYNILNLNVKMKGQKHSVSYAIELMVKSLHSVCVNNEKNMVLPEIINLEIHEYE